MNRDEKKLLIYFDDEEHLIRRLGAALVSCWEELSPELQGRLIERAKQVLDESEAEQLDQQIERFFAAHKAAG